MDTDELPVLLPELPPMVPMVAAEGRVPLSDRRSLRDARRKARQLRRLYAVGGLAVLAGVFAATVLVVVAR